MAERLDDNAIAQMIEQLTGWTRSADGKAIEKIFRFANFNAAFGWMTRAAIKAEQLNHHPEWFNVYNRVEVRLTTHDQDGLTDLDHRLAQAMDKMAAETGGQ
jgi:4a-hydroxytetrahydrobiopterin dehydratase